MTMIQWKTALVRVPLKLPDRKTFPNSVLGGEQDLVVDHVLCVLHFLMAMARGMLHLTMVSRAACPRNDGGAASPSVSPAVP